MTAAQHRNPGPATTRRFCSGNYKTGRREWATVSAQDQRQGQAVRFRLKGRYHRTWFSRDRSAINNQCCGDAHRDKSIPRLPRLPLDLSLAPGWRTNPQSHGEKSDKTSDKPVGQPSVIHNCASSSLQIENWLIMRQIAVSVL